mgnify:CR=1 FL=1
MYKVNIITDCNDWKKKIFKPNNYFKKKISQLSAIKDFNYKNSEFTILLTNNKKMRQLNKMFRNNNKATDVLSFPFTDIIKKKKYLGDIALSYEIINKRSQKTNFNFELDRMWVHGYLHLIGYDHKRRVDFKKMVIAETEILKKLDHKFNL